MGVRVRLPRIETTNVRSFSVQEDATPIDPSSSAGGVGQINFNLTDFPDGPLLLGNVVLADGSRGKTSGTVTSVGGNDSELQVTADSILGLFNTNRTAQPYVGTLGGLVQHYCDMVDIPNDVLTDASISSRSVTYPGWKGNVWVYVKQMLAKEQIEMALVFDRVYVRPLRQIIANQERMSSAGYRVSNSEAAQNVETNYYNYVYGSQREVYPIQGQEPQILIVNSGETQTFTQQLNASLSSVNQPVVLTTVANTTFPGTNGVYSVSGNDGLPVPAAQWTAEGGSLRVSITDDPSVIEVTVKGAINPTLAPFRIAMSSGSSNFYNSLHITGTGVSWTKQTVVIPTGVTVDQSSDILAVTVDNVFISSLSDAINLGTKAAQAHAGLQYTVSGTAYDLNRDGSGEGLLQATVGDFNTAYAGELISDFNLLWTGQTIEQFNEYWQGQVDLLWENQLFGNAPGARILGKDANFRVSSATTTESSVQFTAQLDTLVDDFNNVWLSGGETITKNLLIDPNTTNTANSPSPAAGTVTLGPALGASATSFRHTRTSGSAAAFRLPLESTFVPVPGQTYWWTCRVRSSVAVSGVLVTYRNNVNIATGETVAATVNIPAGESIITGQAPWPTTGAVSTRGVVIRWSPGGVGDTVDIADLGFMDRDVAFFSGSTPDYRANGRRYDYSWASAANASVSQESVTLDYLISDFNDQFAGYTCQEFSTVPLRMV